MPRTQSIPFRKCIPTNAPLGNVFFINAFALFKISLFQLRHFCKGLFIGWTGKLAGAPVNANTGQVSAG